MATQQQAIATETRGRFALPRWLKPGYVVAAVALTLAVFYGALGIGILQQSRAEQELEASVATARKAVTGNPAAVPIEQQAELAKARGELATVEGSLPEQVNARSLATWVLETARTAGVEVISLQTRPTTQRAVVQRPYQVTPFTVAARGQPSDLLAFAAQVERSTDLTVAAKSSQLTVTKDGALLSMELEIYARPLAEPTAATKPNQGQGR